MDIFHLIPPAIVIAVLLGAFGMYRIRMAGENITAQHERRAYDAEVLRRQKHSAEEAARKALEKMPSLRTQLKDHKNPTPPAESMDELLAKHGVSDRDRADIVKGSKLS